MLRLRIPVLNKIAGQYAKVVLLYMTVSICSMYTINFDIIGLNFSYSNSILFMVLICISFMR